MKDKSLVWIIVGIVIVLGIGIGEKLYFNKVADDMVYEINMLEEATFSGNISESAKRLQDTNIKWEKHKKILGLMLDHEEINRITLTLLEIDNNLKTFFDIKDISPNFALLKEYIKNIERENKFTIINLL